MSAVRKLNEPWRPVRCASSWRIYDQDGNAVAKLAASDGPSSDRLAYAARLVAKAPELELLLAELVAVADATAEHCEGGRRLGGQAGPVARDLHRRGLQLLHAIATPETPR